MALRGETRLNAKGARVKVTRAPEWFVCPVCGGAKSRPAKHCMRCREKPTPPHAQLAAELSRFDDRELVRAWQPATLPAIPGIARMVEFAKGEPE
jgi:hypothetical protein